HLYIKVGVVVVWFGGFQAGGARNHVQDRNICVPNLRPTPFLVGVDCFREGADLVKFSSSDYTVKYGIHHITSEQTLMVEEKERRKKKTHFSELSILSIHFTDIITQFF
ncbi:hypothetical protein AVEN_140561-1, partial [Araneus ventricosus]